MGVKQTLRAVPKETSISVLADVIFAIAIAGWARMGDISWPVASVLGLAAAYVVIALVNIYKKSEWPFRQSVEQVVKDAIEHGGYKNINLGNYNLDRPMIIRHHVVIVNQAPRLS